jgi:hypothetical protein
VIVLLWFLNFGISWFNAWAVGSTWDSSKEEGSGGAYFMNWMGAIMSASGFTWCYLIVLGLIATQVPMAWLVDAEEGAEPVTGMLLEGDSLQAFADLGYLVIIVPILGSGLAITVASWRAFARRRTVGDGMVTGWNTFAQVHNTYHAVRALPGVLDRLGGFFGGKSSGSSSGGGKKGGLIVIVLVILAVLGGVITTYAIIQARRKAVILSYAKREALGEL